ncbi:MAG: beta strand repeat-containing protein, partial [Sphaerospermopsis kisseleviana]
MLKSRYNRLFVLLTLLSQVSVKPANAQITPANDGTNTLVNTTGQQINITGGTQAEQNLYHSFQQFGLNQGQIANFLSNPNIINILGRVTGGDASVINGLIQVTGGNSNLFLMNPAGIIFGNNASLNVPASFTATTANAIGVGSNWFNAVGQNNYNLLTGNPNSFAFLNQNSGAILNTGNLITNQGSVTLLGGTVINTGTISTPNGNITIAATPGEKLVRISQEGSLLSLELPIDRSGLNQATNTPLSLPQLLTWANVNHASGVTVENGQLKLTSINQVVPTETGTNIISGISGNIQANNTINILGDKIGIFNGNISTLGTNGGNIFIGGDYQGRATLPTAQFTYIDPNSNIKAEGINGGNIIVWSEQATRIYGNLSVKGNNQGGLIETSSKGYLDITTVPDISGQIGGTWLIDPTDINIVAGGGNTNINNSSPFSSTGDSSSLGVDLITAALNTGNVTVETGSGGTQAGNISLNANLNYSGATSTLTLNAHGNITISNSINSSVNPLNVTLNADSANTSSGWIRINSSITTNGGNFTAKGSTSASATAGILLNSGSSINTGIGDINLTGTSTSTGDSSLASSGIRVNGSLTTTSGNIILTGNKTNVTGNASAIDLLASAPLTTTSGNIILTGINAGNTSLTNGVNIQAPINTNSGSITIMGNNTNSISNASGIVTINSLTTTTGNISLTGTTAGNGTSARGISLNGNVTTNSGEITMTGSRTNTSNSGDGILSNFTNRVITSNTGNITLTSNAGNINISSGNLTAGGSGSTVILQAKNSISLSGAITSNGGNVTLTADSGNTSSGSVRIASNITTNGGDFTAKGNTSSNEAGIDITTDSNIRTGIGNISLTGSSGGSTLSSRGIRLDSGNLITTSGNINLIGYQTNSNGNAGAISTFPAFGITSNSGSGSISFTGSSAGSGNNARGIEIQSRVSTNSGSITITGDNTNLNGNAAGIRVIDSISSNTGNITLTGTSAGSGSSAIGILLQSNVSTDSGHITLTGNNTNGIAEGISSNQSITSNTGNITVNSAGTTTFNTVNAATLLTNAGGTTSLNGNITTTGSQTYNDNVTIANNPTLAGNEITF